MIPRTPVVPGLAIVKEVEYSATLLIVTLIFAFEIDKPGA